MADGDKKITRRECVAEGVRLGGIAIACGAIGAIAARSAGSTVWQIDPLKCTACGRCATECVVAPSAVKCVHQHDMCGYCKLCFGHGLSIGSYT